MRIIKSFLYTAWISHEFKSIGKYSIIKYPIKLVAGKYISIGEKTSIDKRTLMSECDKYGTDVL